MAYFLELEADCVSEDAARRFGAYFAEFTFPLPGGRVCRLDEADTSFFRDSDDHTRCCIVCVGASFTGRREVLRTDDERRGFIFHLYEHLRKAPPYPFAVAGVECHDFSLYGPHGRLDPFDGLVVSEQVFSDAGRPMAFSHLQKVTIGYTVHE